ncbi:MAG: biotin synthase auxiliary protein BsaP [Solirubrobacteraceae bacterium]
MSHAEPEYCDACGRPVTEGEHERCRRRRAATDPPRYCTRCGRKLAVQVLPLGWTARCLRCDPGARHLGGQLAEPS